MATRTSPPAARTPTSAPGSRGAAAAPSKVSPPRAGAPRKRADLFGPLSVAVSLSALALGFVPLVGFISWPLAIVGAVLGIIGATRLLRRHAVSIAGIVIGAIALVVGLAVSVSGLQTIAATMAGPAAGAGAVVPVTRLTPTPSPTRVVDVTAPGDPSVKWILTDPNGTRYGGYPAAQRRVIATIEQADVAYKRASLAKRAGVVARRDAAVCRMLPHGRVTGWVGAVHATGTDETGKGWIELHVAPTIVLQTWDNALSDQGLHTLVPRSSPFYRTLTTVTPGTIVRFSGTLLSSPTSCLQQENLTQDMYGLDPNFIVKLTALAAR